MSWKNRLEGILAKMASARTLEYSEHGFTMPRIFRQVRCKDPVLEKQLADALATEAKLAEFVHSDFLNIGAGWMGPPQFLPWLLFRTHQVGAKQAVADVARYIALDSNPALEIATISGVTVERPLRLASGFILMPFDRIPDSTTKRMIHAGGIAPARPSFDCAMLRRVEVRPRLSRRGDRVPSVETDPLGRDVTKTCLCLTASTLSPARMVHRWFQLASWAPFADHHGSSVTFGSQDAVFRQAGSVEEENRGVAGERFRLLWSLPVGRFEQLRIPLERLNRALRAETWEDWAIDLGVALESLLLEPQEKGELSFRLSLRGARIAEQEPAKREVVFDLLKALYGCRSDAVHTGKLPKKKSGRPVPDILQDSSILAAGLILRFARDGFPNWTEVHLG